MNHNTPFTQEQKELLEGQRVTYTKAGTRNGWKGKIKGIFANKFTVTWDELKQRHQSTNFTTYCITALLGTEDAYIILDNKGLIMSQHNTVTDGKFFMVVDAKGAQRTGMVTEQEALEKASSLARDSHSQEVFFIAKGVEKIFAVKPPIERQDV